MIKELKFSYKKIKYANYSNENTLKDKTNTFCSEFKKLYNSNTLVACIDEVNRVKNKLGTG